MIFQDLRSNSSDLALYIYEQVSYIQYLSVADTPL